MKDKRNQESIYIDAWISKLIAQKAHESGVAKSTIWRQLILKGVGKCFQDGAKNGDD